MVERINYCFSDPFKKHNNAIESVKETEKQSKEAAPLSDFQSSYKGDNSPPTKGGHLRCPPLLAESMIRTGAREKSALCPARARLFGLLISHTTAFRPHRHTISSAKNKRAPIRSALFFADAGKAALLNFFRRNRGRALRKEPKPCYNTVKANEGGRIWQEGSYT